MMKKQKLSMMKWVPALLMLGLCQAAWSFNIPFSTDFESDTIGSEPAGFFALQDTGFLSNSLNVVAAESSFVDGPGSANTGGPGSQALEWYDRDTANSNPDIVIFNYLAPTGTTDDLTIRFDFQRVVNTANDGSLRFQMYSDTGVRGIRLDLNNGGRILNNGSTADGTLEFTNVGKWHALEITTDLANNTYDLVIERDDRGAPDYYFNLPFANPVDNWGSARFEDFSGSSKEGVYNLDNISIEVAIPPEPWIGSYSDDFESYTLGTQVGDPWIVTDTAEAGQSLDISTNQSLFTAGTNGLTYLDTNTNASNPDLRFQLPDPQEGRLYIAFDYMVKSNSGNNITMSLQGTDNVDAMVLRLRSGGALNNQLEPTNTVPLQFIRSIDPGLWYRVEITTSAIDTNAPPAPPEATGNETFDITVTRQFDNAIVTVTNLFFRRDVNTAYSSIYFNDASGASQTSEWTIDNFSVIALDILSPYEVWTTQYELSDGDELPSADPDGDLMINLGEWAFGGNPSDPNDQGIPPAYEIVTDGGITWLVYTTVSNAIATNLVYDVEVATDLVLADWSTAVHEVIGAGDAINVSGFSYITVTNRISTETESKQFVRSLVTEAP